MTVASAVSTNSKWKTYSSTNATLATALSEVMNAVDADGATDRTKFVLTHDGTNFVFVAITKKN